MYLLAISPQELSREQWELHNCPEGEVSTH